jgi:hypothetical protein
MNFAVWYVARIECAQEHAISAAAIMAGALGPQRRGARDFAVSLPDPRPVQPSDHSEHDAGCGCAGAGCCAFAVST